MILEAADSAGLHSMKSKLIKFDEREISEGLCLIGTDEAGRGPGAGAVVAAAVHFPNLDKSLIKELEDINDSKKLTEKSRKRLFDVIINNSVYEIIFGSVEEIEKTNILQTSLNCMKKACLSVIDKVSAEKYKILVDGNKLIPKLDYEQQFLVKGDGKSASIAAASILAKVTRDRYMSELDKKHPEYLWGKNKGYLTKEHLEAIDKYGVTEYHRKSFLEKHFAKQLTLF